MGAGMEDQQTEGLLLLPQTAQRIQAVGVVVAHKSPQVLVALAAPGLSSLSGGSSNGALC